MVYCLERCWKIRVDNSEVKTIAMLRFFSRRITDFIVQQSNFYWKLKIYYSLLTSAINFFLFCIPHNTRKNSVIEVNGLARVLSAY